MFKKILVLMIFLLIMPLANADFDMGKDYKVPDIPPIRVIENGKEVVITLSDAFKYHGDPCPGASIAFRTMAFAINLLWDDVIPDREDMILFSRGPMYGVLDVFTLVKYGDLKSKSDAISRATPGPAIPDGMAPGRDKFWFTVIRKSTGDAVELRVNRKLFPNDFFTLRKKIVANEAASEEKERLDHYKRNLVGKIPAMPVGELFEKPVKYQIIMWGI